MDEVATGLACGLTCPSCEQRLVAENAGSIYSAIITGLPGTSTGNCDGRPHPTCKLLLHERLENCLQDGDSLKIRWPCLHCGCTEAGDLLRYSLSVELEQAVRNIRPDITGFGSDGKETVFVEVVHTHYPEPEVYQVGRHLEVPVVELIVSGDHDIDRVRNSYSLTVLVKNIECRHDKGRCRDCGQRPCAKGGADLPHKRCHGGHCISTSMPSCYCSICEACDPYGNLHRHCACGAIIRGPYRQCFCCHVGCGVGHQREHRHCKDCRRVITAKQKYMGYELWFYERCYPCERKKRNAETAHPL